MMTNCATLSWRLMPRSCLLTAELLVASAGLFGSLGRVAAPASAASAVHMLIAISARNEDIHLYFTAKSLAYARGSVTSFPSHDGQGVLSYRFLRFSVFAVGCDVGGFLVGCLRSSRL